MQPEFPVISKPNFSSRYRRYYVFFSTFDENSDSKNSQTTISNRIFNLTLEKPRSFFIDPRLQKFFFGEDTYKMVQCLKRTSLFASFHQPLSSMLPDKCTSHPDTSNHLYSPHQSCKLLQIVLLYAYLEVKMSEQLKVEYSYHIFIRNFCIVLKSREYDHFFYRSIYFSK
uniref:Bm395, isoform a n=1 Tax=Brugia malayi TaxID=6279 RepID=A0A1I9GF32_BRUMA|nr:Bm395, isoform a [Brugia malayi]